MFWYIYCIVIGYNKICGIKNGNNKFVKGSIVNCCLYINMKLY